jgi:hypothetical protein
MIDLREHVEYARQRLGGIPIPVSRTDTTTSLSAGVTVSQMWPPRSMYFAALLRRLEKICASRTGSASR